jgi:hypothetical protein
MTGAALCVGVFLLAWIGKKWLDYSDALVEEQQAQIRKLAEEMRRDEQDQAARRRLLRHNY